MVAPSSREIQATSPNDTVIICITCALAAAKAQGAVKINPLTESQKQEIKEAINRGKY
jgi:capsular polysaccharide biosynthesis protein